MRCEPANTDWVDAVILRVDVHRALLSLAPPERALVMECLVEEKPLPAVARALNLTVAEAQQRLMNALRHLRDALT